MAKTTASLWVALFTCSCGAMDHRVETAGSAAGAPMHAAVPMADAPPSGPANDAPGPVPVGLALPVPAPQAGSPGANAVAPAQPTGANAQPQVAREMLDIQASMRIKVAALQDSMKAIHALARKHGGTVVEERITSHGPGNSREASLKLRVPSGASDAFFDELRRVGQVISQEISARDIGKEFHDASILLRNLEATLQRYEEILQKAQTVEEILKIEAELSRIRGEIDRVKGNLRWMADRAARATVTVMLVTDLPQPEIAAEEPEARFYPGVRATYVGDYRGDDGGAGYAGGGLSLRLSRAFGVEIDGLRGLDSDTRGLDLFLVTAGGDVFSEFLGDGKRRFLNPYLGLRFGYARFLGHDEGVAGATLGLELYKSDFLTIDADVRLLGFFFGDPGAHAAVQPSLGANVAF